VTGIPTSIKQNGFPSPNYLGNSSLYTFYSGTALATSTSTELTFTASSPDTTSTVEIDNVSVTAPASVVPEPSTLMLAIIGGIGSLASPHELTDEQPERFSHGRILTRSVSEGDQIWILADASG